MSAPVETTITCDFCGTENRLVAVGLVTNEVVRCSHCGKKLDTYEHLAELAAKTKPPENSPHEGGEGR